jgi:hypothetical protein
LVSCRGRYSFFLVASGVEQQSSQEPPPLIIVSRYFPTGWSRARFSPPPCAGHGSWNGNPKIRGDGVESFLSSPSLGRRP